MESNLRHRPGRWQGWASTLIFIFTVVLSLQTNGQETILPKDKANQDTGNVLFATRIRPILETHCLECHGGKSTRSGFNLSTREGLLRGGDSGMPALVPGQAEQSLLYRKITHADDPGMPYKREKLPEKDIAEVVSWINAGAPYDQPLVSNEEEFWSLKPLNRIEPPPLSSLKHERWVRTPIDRFILGKLEEKGMAPSIEADKRTLLRRVTLDLTGLLPTPEELDGFLADKSAEAYPRVVDRLLSSPRYGERWARHWLDIVHFAETHGNDQDRPRTNSWPYRDYLIRSFNDDKPYARFVEEQLAGDVLYPEDPQGIVATGLIAAGPWDESSQLNIMEDTVDKKIVRYLDRDDMVTTAMSTFVSATVHCARCHNHKFDPIPQREYYSLQAVFAGVDRADRPYDLDPKINSLRQALLKEKTALDVRPQEVAKMLLAPETQTQVAAWEQSLGGQPSIWTPLDPAQFSSSQGATLTKQADLSLLASGTRPDTDSYTIVAETKLKNITAVRVEVLANDSLPHKGPGRQDNGNLHLSEFKVEMAPASEAGATNRPAGLQNPTADFNQKEWEIGKAIDGKTNTAWGIYPEVGKSHLAVFETKENVGFEGGTKLTFALDQRHGQSHLIGRLRLSVTTAARPVRANPFPENVSKILALSIDRRSDQDKADLAAYYLKEQINSKLAALPPPLMVYAAASDFTPEGNFTPAKVPRPIHVLKRGDITKTGDLVSPGALSCVSGLESRFQLADPNDEGSRRAALARWITVPKNPLTWRSVVNRVWHYHFGQGIVDTPNDFGRMGSRPTHPELLDWLAAWFLEHGGSLKQLHKVILTSSVYRQSSQNSAKFASIDSGNLYLWRMNRNRLDAESVRDAVLQITGKIELTMGGPSVKQFVQTPGIHVTPTVDYASFNVDSPESYRRSVYRFLFRTLPDPFMDSMDCADASQLTPARNTSVTALQALAMLNNHFIVRQSEHFAERVGEMGKTLPTQLTAAYELALGRKPTSEEAQALTEYAVKHGMANTCRVILNSNEFIFVN